ncbi:Uncharacterized protein PECH_001921 [Penicillium ucsense]|uniref:Piwi domain-containing protein n=1 Tax=Penicillium ucsense TaxID=2839758 RepID=A0A8J8VYM6_9EURO|nr:Uncharacterized protein PECM_008409 [Penicillium ucsense]KAF7731484.1 Uncharacterized protein PECH_001921 [Penicillium ucsense]
MSDQPRGRGGRGRGPRGGDVGDRGGGRGGGGRGRGDFQDLPFRPSERGGRGDFRGDFRGGRGGGRGDFRGRGRGGFGGPPGPRIHNEGNAIPPPDAVVTKTEDATAKALVANYQKNGKNAAQAYPDRPGYGTLGRPVTLYANYLPFTSTGKPIYRYHVSIAAEGGREPAGRKARQIVRLLLEEHFPDKLNSVATDYRSTLISVSKLKDGTFDVRYKDENDEDYPENPKVFKVTTQHTGDINPAELINYLTSTNAGNMLTSKPEIIQALNLILGHHPKTNREVASIGGNRHYSFQGGTMESASLEGGLEVLRGFFVSVRAATARILLNVQVKYLACYQAGPLTQVIGDWLYSNRSQKNYRLEAFLKRMRVSITHIKRKGRNGKERPARVKTISGLATPQDGGSNANRPRVDVFGAGPHAVKFFLEGPGPQPSPPGSEEPKGKKGKKGKKAPPRAGPTPAGQYVSVADFFKKEYNITVNPDLPVVNVGTRDKPVYLPVEVCEVEAGQPVKNKLSPRQTQNMLNFAVKGRTPAQNAQSIVTKGVGVLGIGQPLNATLASFGINVGNALVTVQGRVLPPPKIMYAKQQELQAKFGSWNMQSIQFCKPATLKSWTWLFIDAPGSRHGLDRATLSQGLENLTRTLRDMGVSVEGHKAGKRIELPRKGDSATVIEKAVRELQAVHNPQMILGILYAKETEVYNTMKQVCDVRCGVRNVNVLAEKVRGANVQYWANVGLKLNLKMGGANQTLRNSDLGFFADGKTMLVGLDVTHPSPGSASTAPSVVGIVASVDAQLAQWPADIRIQPARQEIVSDLDTLLQSRIKLWANTNRGKLPENIVVYRDGVSEGQYDIVIDKELPLLKRACETMYPASDTKKGLPRMAIVIVGKRHNTRFYPTSDKDAERSANPQPGTVVDRGISEARHWDFYLQAHSCLQGTARPAHYFTVWDEIFYPLYPGVGQSGAADRLQDLTHKMCYLFGRATKAVSVCPPAYYADLVCTRARCFMSDLFDPSPSATPAGSVVKSEGGSRVPEESQAAVHASVKDTMFYI